MKKNTHKSFEHLDSVEHWRCLDQVFLAPKHCHYKKKSSYIVIHASGICFVSPAFKFTINSISLTSMDIKQKLTIQDQLNPFIEDLPSIDKSLNSLKG